MNAETNNTNVQQQERGNKDINGLIDNADGRTIKDCLIIGFGIAFPVAYVSLFDNSIPVVLACIMCFIFLVHELDEKRERRKMKILAEILKKLNSKNE